jgi:membrane associated rhomboid family serine protease/TPR repeat protein
LFPISSNYPVRGRTPVTWAIIGLCAAIALLQLFEDPPFSSETFRRFGAHPAFVVFDILPWNRDSPFVAGTLLSSLFIHAGILHVVGNMLFFHCFSRAVESLMGSVRYAVFYLLCGVAATLVHSFFNPDSATPLIGASGAVAGVLGAHALLLPWTRIEISSRGLFDPKSLPAWSFMAYWLAFQFVLGLDSRSDVAWLAHLGGVGAGLMLAPLFSRPGVLVLAPTPETDDGKEHGQGRKVPMAAALGLAGLLIAGLAGWGVITQSHADAKTLANAKAAIGAARLIGDLVPLQPESGLALSREAAAINPYVATALAKRLRAGDGVPKDEVEAIKWFQRGAEGGDKEAMAAYGLALIQGNNLPRDADRGAAMLRDLSKRGYGGADLQLGLMLESGRDGAVVDLEGAARSYQRACEAEAQWRGEKIARSSGCYHWALMLFAGHGVAADRVKAREVLERAAMEGSAEANNALGLWLATGDPQAADIEPEAGPQDSRAWHYLFEAAIRGNAEAMYNLARLDELRPRPLSMTPDKIRSWYEKSAALGNEKAKAALARILNQH